MRSRTKRYILAALTLCMSCVAWGQSQTQARKWFVEGEYEKAKPVFAKLVKGNPRSGSLNYWYGVCLNETGEHDKALTYLKKAVDSDVENAYRYMGDYLLADGNFEEAIAHYEEYLGKVDPTDTMFVIYTRRAERAKHEMKFYKRVAKVTFVDSVIVAKDKFLEVYKLGKECGEVAPTQMLLENTSVEGTAYRTEMRDKVYYSDVDGYGVMQLYMCYKMLGDWSKPILLEGMPEGDNSYPYMLSDGMTIYFANNNPSGLGGYDIYVTRYNSETDRYLVAQNVGMPFNSAANDYMMAIDEVNNLGWFVTDRNQPEGMVCVYTFIPTDTKQYYKYGEDSFEDIRNAAQIHSIAATQTDQQAVEKAKQTIFRLGLKLKDEEEKKDFTFVVDDFTIYHSLDDFKCAEARQLYADWQSKRMELEKLGKALEEMREQYTRASNNDRKKMTDELLRLEQQYEKFETEVMGMPMAIRNMEINYIKK